jgi:hypothetical protein
MTNKENLEQEGKGNLNNRYLFREADIVKRIEEDQLFSACLEINPNLINKESFYKNYSGGRR